jgi:hypothetical protein
VESIAPFTCCSFLKSRQTQLDENAQKFVEKSELQSQQIFAKNVHSDPFPLLSLFKRLISEK